MVQWKIFIGYINNLCIPLWKVNGERSTISVSLSIVFLGLVLILSLVLVLDKSTPILFNIKISEV